MIVIIIIIIIIIIINKRLHDRSKLTQICAKLIFKRFASFPLNGNLLF